MRRTLSRAAALAGLVLGSAALAQPPQNQLPQPRITSAFPCGGEGRHGRRGHGQRHRPGRRHRPAVLAPGHHRRGRSPEPKPDPKAKEPKKRGRAQGREAPATVAVQGDGPGRRAGRAVRRAGGEPVRREQPAGVRRSATGPRSRSWSRTTTPWPPTRRPAAVAGGPAMLPTRNAPRAQRVELGTTVNGVDRQPDRRRLRRLRRQGRAAGAGRAASPRRSTAGRGRSSRCTTRPAGGSGMNRNYKDSDALARRRPCRPTATTSSGSASSPTSRAGRTTSTGSPSAPGRGSTPSSRRRSNPGKPTQVTLYGRNLPGGKPVAGVRRRPAGRDGDVTVTPPTDRDAVRLPRPGPAADGLQDAFEYRLTGPHGASNAVPIFLDRRQGGAREGGGNDKPEAAEPIPVPCEVAGRIDKRNDRDWYASPRRRATSCSSS